MLVFFREVGRTEYKRLLLYVGLYPVICLESPTHLYRRVLEVLTCLRTYHQCDEGSNTRVLTDMTVGPLRPSNCSLIRRCHFN